MRKILTSFSLVAASLAFAQVGINVNETEIADDALFHVKNKDTEAKGVILPKVTLTSETDQTTITGGAVTTGLMVWNNGSTSGLNPAGYYYWDGAKWILTGNVDSGTTTPFLGNTKGKIRVLGNTELMVASTWQDDDFALVITYLSNTDNPELPDPTGDNEGRIIAVVNTVGQSVSFGGSTPLPNSSLRKNTGAMYMSDGNRWYQIAAF